MMNEDLCALCAAGKCGDDLEMVSLDSTDQEIIEILERFGFDFNSSLAKICSNCVSTIQQFNDFIDKCRNAQHFLSLGAGLDSEVKDEFIDSNDIEALDCEGNSISGQFIESDLAVIEDDMILEDETAVIENAIETQLEQCSEDLQLEYSCHLCGTQHEDFAGLQRHCRDEHDSNCSVTCACGATLSSRAQINVHRKQHQTKHYSCDHCNKNFKSSPALQNHMQKYHIKLANPMLTCTQCHKQFDAEKKLKSHLATHLPADKKMIFPCDYCEKKFTKSINVQAHIKAIHQLERNHLCSECGKNFSTKGALKEHQIIHQNIYPYQCASCPKKFKNLPRLKTHTDTHNSTKYICNVCGISLNTKRTLKMHMVVHSDQKKYKCQYCGSSFKRSKALKNHLILHSGLRPYACDFCDKTFANGSNCRSHKKKAHPNELAAKEASGTTGSSNSVCLPRLEQLQPKASSNENKQEPEHNSENIEVHFMAPLVAQ